METIATIQPKNILKMVEEKLQIPNLKIKDRSRDVYQARFIYFKLARKYCKYASLSRIGKEVDRDHATVINGLKKYDMEAKYDPYMGDIYDNIASKIDKKYIKPRRPENEDITLDKLLDKVNMLEDKINKLKL
jgi:chromosomal replication initiation ATPase DnaA